MTATELANYGSALPSLSSPIAESGDKRAPIAGISNETDTQASVKFGLPALMSEPMDQDGIPVPRQDLNGIYNLLSKIVHFLMAGGRIPYMASESEAIGGYPAGAEVSYQGHNYKSLVDSNTAVPTDSTKWACIDYLPLTGGAISGIIHSNADAASLPSILGTNHVALQAGNIYLAITKDGQMVYNGKNVVRSVNGVDANFWGNIDLAVWPNYELRFAIPNGWTTTSNGWMIFARGASGGLAVGYIDGVEVWNSTKYEAHYGCGMVPVAKGSYVSFNEYITRAEFVTAKVS